MLNRTNYKIHKIQLSILSQYQPRPTCLNPKPYPLRPYAPMRLPQTPGLFLRRRWRIRTGVRAACDCSYLWPSMARQLPHPQWPFPFLFSFPLPARLRAAHACAVRACMGCAACSRSRPLEEQRGLWPCTSWPPYKQHHTPTQVQLLVLDSRAVRVEPDPGRAGRADLGGSLALWCVMLSCHVAPWLGTRPVCQWGPTRDWQSWSVLALCGLRAPGL